MPDRAPPFELETTIGGRPERSAKLRPGRSFIVRYWCTQIMIERVSRE